MNLPHKRPRKAVMRLGMLNANVTGRSNVLLDRARSYLTGDEVFDELYGHALDLEKQVEENDQTETINEAREKLNDLREAVDGVKEDLERKQKEREEIVKRFSNVLDDEAIPKLEEALAKVSADKGADLKGEAETLLRDVLAHLRAIGSDVDDIPTLEEQVGTLNDAWSDSE